MGCDIRIYVERKSNSWNLVSELDIRRNYDLFAILADVRNGYGTAGVNRSEGFNPISDPRGLPADISDEVKEIVEGSLLDKFGYSWLSLGELLAYDWSQTTTQFAVLNAKEYQAFLRDGYPSAGGRRGLISDRAKMISEYDMRKLLSNEVERKPETDYYTSVSWPETYGQAVGQQWLDMLQGLADKYGSKNIRLVFWFTS